jgi:hypothetical protein
VCISINALSTNKEGHIVSVLLSYHIFHIFFCCRLRMSDVEVIPPEGKTSFSGIPESQFIDDVALYMKVINPVWLTTVIESGSSILGGISITVGIQDFYVYKQKK